MRFKFRPEPTIVRPSFPVFLIPAKGDDDVPCDALIDTGAEICLYDAKYCKALGLDFKRGRAKETNGMGPGGGLEGYFHPIRYDTNVGGHSAIETEALFVVKLEQYCGFYGILGSAGFLDKFSVLVNVKDRYCDVDYIG